MVLIFTLFYLKPCFGEAFQHPALIKKKHKQNKDQWNTFKKKNALHHIMTRIKSISGIHNLRHFEPPLEDVAIKHTGYVSHAVITCAHAFLCLHGGVMPWTEHIIMTRVKSISGIHNLRHFEPPLEDVAIKHRAYVSHVVITCAHAFLCLHRRVMPWTEHMVGLFLSFFHRRYRFNCGRTNN